MKKVISQEAFNEAVQENINDLEMEPNEAIEETIKQFELQGVDLSNIIKTLNMVQGNDPVKELADKLKSVTLSAQPEQFGEVIDNLCMTKKLCSMDMAYKLLAGKHGIYSTIMLILNNPSNDEKLIESCLETLIELMDGYPDLLDDSGTNYIMMALEKAESYSILKLVLHWVWVCCIRHEENRQKFFSRGLVTLLKRFVKTEMDPAVLKAACSVIWSMTLDDDIRAPLPNAHTHACALALEFLEPLILVLLNSKDESILSEAANALCSLLVRNEFCSIVSSNGGVQVIIDMLSTYFSNQVLTRRLFKLLTNLAGNDEVKNDIVKTGASERITTLLNRNIADVAFAYTALLLISKLCLREGKNGAAFINAGALELIVSAMKMHQTADVQRAGCWALRNIASHNKNAKDQFLKLEIDDMLNQVASEHKEVAQDAVSALIALDCEVDLTERWTGECGDKLMKN